MAMNVTDDTKSTEQDIFGRLIVAQLVSITTAL